VAQERYCWRCGVVVPMLDEHEWERVEPLLANAIEQIKSYREIHGCSLSDARAKGYGQEALQMYEAITGFHEKNPDVLWHHRLAIFGPPCAACGKPLRTPIAKFCAECGAQR
jgi:hypothetical protein